MLIEIAFHCNTLHLIAALPGLNNFKHFTRYRHVNIHIHLFIIHHGWLCLPFLELPKEAEAKTDKEASGWVFSTVRPRSPKKVWISSDHFFSDENHDIISLWDYMYNYSYIIIYTIIIWYNSPQKLIQHLKDPTSDHCSQVENSPVSDGTTSTSTLNLGESPGSTSAEC